MLSYNISYQKCKENLIKLLNWIIFIRNVQKLPNVFLEFFVVRLRLDIYIYVYKGFDISKL